MRGAILGGRYQLREPLGAGGMGTVWRAHDRLRGRGVAVKTLTGFAESATSELARRFRREIQVASLLRDPHIVEAHDSGEAFVDGRPLLYLVMEEVPGEPLNRLLGTRTPSLAEITRWGDGICAALEAMHRAGVVHRDLKPANVMIGPDGHATVLDFGIARLEGERLDLPTLTRTGHVVGTVAYMSPEQAVGTVPLDGRSDLYSLGCLLYAALVGRPPFSEGPWHLVPHQHVHQAPLPPGELRDGLPAAWDVLVLDLLAKAPEDRPPTAAAVRERIAGLPLPVDAPPVPVAAPSLAATMIDPDAITSEVSEASDISDASEAHDASDASDISDASDVSDVSAVVGVHADPNASTVLGGGQEATTPRYPGLDPNPAPNPIPAPTTGPIPTAALTRPLPGSALPPPRVLSGDEVIARSLTAQQLLGLGAVVLLVLGGLVALTLVISGREVGPSLGTSGFITVGGLLAAVLIGLLYSDYVYRWRPRRVAARQRRAADEDAPSHWEDETDEAEEVRKAARGAASFAQQDALAVLASAISNGQALWVAYEFQKRLWWVHLHPLRFDRGYLVGLTVQTRKDFHIAEFRLRGTSGTRLDGV
ncbi:serine/threonine-protein kinase [Streptomyces sp. NPDC059452]|uniref:serine/threonine-protein kinase n=1 Tax=Streptomyces sp. NPDC059452 TaxID=3346835 RepID=UPI0036BF1F8D